MKKLFFLLLMTLLSSSVYPQAWVWEKPINVSSNDIVTDPNNNIIVLSKNGSAAQLSKFTKDGILLFTTLLGKAGSFIYSGSLVVDKTGSIYIFTKGFDSINHVFTGVRSPGITKFSANGNFLWHVNYFTTCTSGIVKHLSLKIDADDNIYVGLFVDFVSSSCVTKTVTLGNISKNPTHVAVNGTPTPASPRYYSLGSLTNSGTVRWLKVLSTNFQNSGTPSLKISQELALAGQSIYLTGTVHNHVIFLDEGNSISVSGINNSPWVLSFNAINGNPNWGIEQKKLNNGNSFDTGTARINVNLQTGKLAFTYSMGGQVVIVTGDTLNTYTFYPLSWQLRAYYVIYDTLGNKIKSKKLNIVPNVYGENETVLGSRGRFFFVKSMDSLIKVDTGYNQLWRLTLPPATEKIFIPQSSNDIIVTYTKAGVVYLAKMVDSAGMISGKTYADWDNNNVYTPGADSLLSNILITTNTAASGISGNDSGKYYLYAPPGTYAVNANFNHPYYQFLPASYNATIIQYSDTIQGKDFRLHPLSAFTDVSTTLTALNVARPGRQALYSVSVKNWSPTITPVQVGLKLPALTNYASVSGGTVTVNAPDSITIDMGNVSPFEVRKAILTLNIATTATLHDTLHFYPVVYPYATDAIQSNNIDTLVQPVRTSFDPNEKEANVAGQPIADVTKDIEYTVRFQNTGNDTAFYVRLADTLSAKLNLASFNFIDASHPVSVEINNDVLQFVFNPIYLVDSNHNEPASHGFVKFSVRPAASVIAGDTIYNNAAIYFDYNSPVITNTAKSWYYAAALPVTIVSLDASPAANTVIVKFVTAQEINIKSFIIEKSSDGIHFTTAGTVTPYGNAAGGTYYFTDNSPVKPIGFYRLKIIDNDGRFRYSNIAAAKFTTNNKNGISIFPNPASDHLLLVLSGSTATNAKYYRVTDIRGKTILKKMVSGNAAGNTFTIDATSLPTGVYNLEMATATGETYLQKFVIRR